MNRRETTTDVVARVLSEAAAPWVWNIVVPIVVGVSVGSVSWGLFAAAILGLLPMIVIIGLMAFRQVVDHHVSNKAERPFVVVAIAVVVVAGFITMVIDSAPTELATLVAAGFVVVVVAGGITAATSYKVSFHAAVAWGQTLALVLIAQSVWLIVPILVATGTCWARLQRQAHTRSEVAIGTGVGLVCVASVSSSSTLCTERRAPHSRTRADTSQRPARPHPLVEP